MASTSWQAPPTPWMILRVRIDLWPTVFRFRRGHRIRLQVESGAHPHFARNQGLGELPGTATTLRVPEQQVYHDPDYPSAIILPVTTNAAFADSG